MIKIIILFIFNKFANAFFIFFREYTKIPSFPRSRESERVRTETYIPSFPRISRHSHVYPVIPTYIPSFPRRRESSALSFSYLE
ncbi:Uncharacterised protein [Neisseria meningitidis]|nr:Uncharacterised protein [Neisseria meningitidis]CWU24921.1 Uncharacterised protein [Neisseria meningitidis]